MLFNGTDVPPNGFITFTMMEIHIPNDGNNIVYVSFESHAEGLGLVNVFASPAEDMRPELDHTRLVGCHYIAIVKTRENFERKQYPNRKRLFLAQISSHFEI